MQEVFLDFSARCLSSERRLNRLEMARSSPNWITYTASNSIGTRHASVPYLTFIAITNRENSHALSAVAQFPPLMNTRVISPVAVREYSNVRVAGSAADSKYVLLLHNE